MLILALLSLLPVLTGLRFSKKLKAVSPREFRFPDIPQFELSGVLRTPVEKATTFFGSLGFDGSWLQPPKPPKKIFEGVMEFGRGSIAGLPLFNRGNATDVYDTQVGDSVVNAEALLKWWEKKSIGRKGLLVWLMPALLSQLALLQTIIPFITDRLLQYVQPELVIVTTMLSRQVTLNVLKVAFSASIWTGLWYMLQDTYVAGSRWSPVGKPAGDSYALVTGASSGLGRDIAALLYADGYNVVMVGTSKSELDEAQEAVEDFVRRREKTLHEKMGGKWGWDDGDVNSRKQKYKKKDKYRNKLGSGSANDNEQNYQVYRETVVLPCDLYDQNAATRLARQLRGMGIDKRLDILVNAHEPSTNNRDVSDLEMIHASTVTITGMCKQLAPAMSMRASNGHGARILIMGSSAGLAPSPDAAVYAASKSFLNSYAKSLRRQLLPSGVLVTLAMPGPVFPSKTKPLLSKSTNSVATYRAMRQGRDMIVPGILNKGYVSVVTKLVPPAALGAVARHLWRMVAEQTKMKGGSVDHETGYDSHGGVDDSIRNGPFGSMDGEEEWNYDLEEDMPFPPLHNDIDLDGHFPWLTRPDEKEEFFGWGDDIGQDRIVT